MSLSNELRAQAEKSQQVTPAGALEVINQATAELVESGLAEKALNVGAPAPTFTLPSATGHDVALDSLLADGPVVLTFYRGAWCPYCNIALRSLQDNLAAITARGARLVAISPQIADESLSLAEKHELAFDVLSDIGSIVAKQYGVAFDISDELGAVYDGFGLELGRVNAGHYTLPVPATYVLDRSGIIRWAFIDPDFTKRAEPADILAALDALGEA